MRVTAVIVKNNEVLLMHRKRDGEEYWLFPCGSIEEGESELEALKREVKEETSLDVTFSRRDTYFKDTNGLHPIFYCEVADGKAEIEKGSPEALQHSLKDWYHLEWIEADKALKLNNLYPEPGKKILKER